MVWPLCKYLLAPLGVLTVRLILWRVCRRIFSYMQLLGLLPATLLRLRRDLARLEANNTQIVDLTNTNFVRAASYIEELQHEVRRLHTNNYHLRELVHALNAEVDDLITDMGWLTRECVRLSRELFSADNEWSFDGLDFPVFPPDDDDASADEGFVGHIPPEPNPPLLPIQPMPAHSPPSPVMPPPSPASVVSGDVLTNDDSLTYSSVDSDEDLLDL